MITETQRINTIINMTARTGMTLEQIIRREIELWMESDVRREMITGEKYWRNEMDKAEFETRGELRRSKMSNGFVRKLVKQKTDYLLSKPFSVVAENQQYLERLNAIYGKRFAQVLKRLGREAINKGIAWLQVYFTEGEIAFAAIPSEEIIPLWADGAHTALDGVIRVYIREEYQGIDKRDVRHVEYWNSSGVRKYIYTETGLVPDVESESGPHFFINGEPYNWERVPFVAFKYNDDELPLIHGLKESVDDYNEQKAIVSGLLKDIPNFIYVIKNYGGVDLQQFMEELRKVNAVRVEDNGGVDKLQADIDTTAFQAYQQNNRKDIYEFGRGVDTQNEDFGNASGVALRMRYADLDMDCNDLETEFSASMDQLKWFVDRYLLMTGAGDFTKETVTVVFNRDIIINEAEAITQCRDSVGVISDRTIVANHPWVTDVDTELEQIEREREETDPYTQDSAPQDGEADEAE